MPVIQLLAFRGTGGILNQNSPYFESEPGLIRAGHVGLQGVIEDKIIGFSPAPEAIKSAGSEQKLLDMLVRKHQAQVGQLQDDTAIFNRAYELIDETHRRTTVWMLDVEVSQETIERLIKWYNEKYTALYNLPERQPPEFEDNEYNCATFPAKLDVPVPARTGKLQLFIKYMIEKGAVQWEPENL